MRALGADLAALQSGLEAHGLSLRGGFDLEPGEQAAIPSAAPVRSLLLIGNVGGSIWPHFERWRRAQAAAIDNPLDTWSRAIIERAALEAGALAVFPSDKPHLPFQQWAMRAEALRPSPLGILMHPRYGLWHAYRGALLFDRQFGIGGASAGPHLCDSCAAKPCLRACPVGAHSEAGFDYGGCLDHVRGADSAGCTRAGCRDRNACPNSSEWRYPVEMQRFLMDAFAS